MYLGIDLGTSNSAIVGNSGGELRLFKTADGTDVLPSVLYIDRRGSRFVGRKAYDQALLSPQNVARGFKRSMGTKTPFHLEASGVDVSPEEASAEVLRALITQARAEIGDFDVKGAVITVPAAFNQMQSEATIRAAAAAGLERVGLLQEPIAAAMASLEKAPNRDGLFLVYDLGGGTFDVALVQSIKGAVTILAHEGINALGGLNFDTAILNSVIRPWLLDQYDLAEDFQRDPKFKRLIRIAQLKGEQAKIELSTRDSATIFVSEDDARATDRAGAEIYIEATLSRDDLNRLIEEKISETIELCRKILSDNGLTNDDIDRVVLIGGPSKMPAVRDRVPRELGIAVDLNTDPMTAVARGAAVYAESRVWDGAVSRRKANMETTQTGGELQVKYDYEARTTSNEARIKAVVTSGDATGCRISVSTADGRESGQQDLAKSPVIKVPLEKAGENRVRVTVSDASGRRVDASAELIITRVVASSAGKPATQTIAVKAVTGASGFERNVLQPLIKKGETLPKSGTIPFRANKTVRPNSGDRLLIELFQQDDGVIEPDLNLWIGSLQLGAHLLDDHQVLREGQEVRIHWQLDDNGILTASAEVPALGIHIADEKIYVDQLALVNFDGESGRTIVGEALVSAERDLDQLEEDLGNRAGPEIATLRRRMQRQYDDYVNCVEADGFRVISEEVRYIRQECSRLRHSGRFRKDSLAAELARVQSILDDVSTEPGDQRSNRVPQLVQTTKHALADSQHDDAERAIEELRMVVFSILREQPSFVAAQFQHLAKGRHLAIDPILHENLVEEGLRALKNSDMDGLRQVIGKLIENSAVQVSPGHDLAALADLAAH